MQYFVIIFNKIYEFYGILFIVGEDMDKKKVVRYFLLYDAYSRNNNMEFTSEQFELINEVNKYAKSNKDFEEFITRLRSVSYYEREEIINEFYNKRVEKEKEETKNPVEEISKVFGVDISKISHKRLGSGIEVFSFYDYNASRYVVLENKKDGKSLVEQLKEIGEYDTKYHSNDKEKNAHDILSDKRVKENIELSMIPINQVDNYLGTVGNLRKEDYEKLLFLIRNAKNLFIDYINLENMIGIDSNGKIYEVRGNTKDEFKIGEADSVVYTSEVYDGEDKADSGYIKEEKEEDIEFNYLSEEDRERTIMLYENPKELDNVNEELRERYKKYIEMYKKYLLFLERKAQEKKNTNTLVRTLKKEDNGGFASMNIILLVLEFLSISTFTFLLLKVFAK